MRTDREAQGKAEGPWERHGALGRGIPMLFLRRQRDLGKTRAWGGRGTWERQGPGVGNSHAICGHR